jgi:hypothetical protein
LGREIRPRPDKIGSPIPGIAKDGPDEFDESFAVRRLEVLVDLSPKIEPKNENKGDRSRNEKEEGETGVCVS